MYKRQTVNGTTDLKDNTIYLRAKFSSDGKRISQSEGGHDLLVICLLYTSKLSHYYFFRKQLVRAAYGKIIKKRKNKKLIAGYDENTSLQSTL